MRASEVIFRTLAKERHRSAADNLSKSKADPARSNRQSLECEVSEKEGRNARWGKQVIVTACTTRGLCFPVLQLKANSVQR